MPDQPTPDHILQLGLGFWGSKTLLSALELGLFTELAKGAADGAIAGPALTAALLALRKELLNPETRKRSAHDALQYYAKLGITTHRDCGAFHAGQSKLG